MGNISNRDKEKTQSYIIEAMSWLADAVENGEKRKDGDLAVYLEVCGTNNTSRIAYTHISGDPPNVFTLTIGVYRNGSDRIYSQYDFVGTNEEFYEYVRKPVYEYRKFYERIMSMSDRSDEYWS